MHDALSKAQACSKQELLSHSLGFDKVSPAKQLGRWGQGGEGSETWQDRGYCPRGCCMGQDLWWAPVLDVQGSRAAPQQLWGRDADVLSPLHFRGGSKTSAEARLSVLQQNLQSCHLPGLWQAAELARCCCPPSQLGACKGRQWASRHGFPNQ